MADMAQREPSGFPYNAEKSVFIKYYIGFYEMEEG